MTVEHGFRCAFFVFIFFDFSFYFVGWCKRQAFTKSFYFPLIALQIVIIIIVNDSDADLSHIRGASGCRNK